MDSKVDISDWPFPSDAFYRTAEIFPIIISTISLVMFIAYTIILFRYSPVEMKNYKWHLLVNHLFFVLLECVGIILHPKIVLPITALSLHSYLLKMFSVSSELYVFIGAGVTYTLGGCYAYSLMILFIYRYAQTTNKQVVMRFLTAKKSILVHMILLILADSFSARNVLHVAIFDAELKELYRTLYPEIYKRIANQTLIGLKVAFNRDFMYRSLI